jgi:hypothetical protein
MVQLHEDVTKSNTYWKLNSGVSLPNRRLRHRVRSMDLPTLRKTPASRVRELYIRFQRGLICYEGLSIRELRRFAAQRGLAVSTEATRNSFKALRAILEKADDDATFERFSDLPPELRQIVFLHYFDSLADRKVRYKRQPPITLVSRTLREEALPLFYERCEFTIGAVGDLRTIPCKLVPDIHAASFLQNTAVEHFRRIKSLNLEFHKLGICIRLDLNNKDDPVVSAQVQRASSEAADEWFFSELRAFAMSIAAREGPLKLRMSDVEEICEMSRQNHDSTVPRKRRRRQWKLEVFGKRC